MWNSWRETPAFRPGTPWLLRCFDQIRFFPVTHAELSDARAAFPHGAYPIVIEESRFAFADHAAGLVRDEAGIAAVKTRQQVAFEAERARWQRDGLDVAPPDSIGPTGPDEALPDGCVAVTSSIPGTIWTLTVEVGAIIEAGEPVAIIESMKMEMPVAAAIGGRLREIRVRRGQTVRSGDVIAIIETV